MSESAEDYESFDSMWDGGASPYAEDEDDIRERNRLCGCGGIGTHGVDHNDY